MAERAWHLVGANIRRLNPQRFALVGVKHPDCGHLLFPPRPTCIACEKQRLPLESGQSGLIPQRNGHSKNGSPANNLNKQPLLQKLTTSK